MRDLMVTTTKAALIVALISSTYLLLNDSKHMPYADPWFVPVILIILWQTFKYDP